MQTEITTKEKERNPIPNPLLILLGPFLAAASFLLVLVAGFRANPPGALALPMAGWQTQGAGLAEGSGEEPCHLPWPFAN